MTPYYDQDGITIFHGDCREILPTLSGVDLIFTSPQFNLGSEPWPKLSNWKTGDSKTGKSKWRNGSDAGGGIRYAGHGDDMPWPDYVVLQREALWLMDLALAEDGAIFYNHKPRPIGGKLWLPFELIHQNLQVDLRQIITWDRGGGMNYNPTAFVPCCEWLLLLARPDWRLTSRGAAGLGDVWRVPPARDSEHPAPFPVELPHKAIETSGAQTVLDPFMGSGTTLRAAKDLGRRAIGIEIEETYCELAVKRLAQEALDVGAVQT